MSTAGVQRQLVLELLMHRITDKTSRHWLLLFIICSCRKHYKLPTATTIAKLVRIIQAPKGLQFWATEGMALALIYQITGLLYVSL